MRRGELFLRSATQTVAFPLFTSTRMRARQSRNTGRELYTVKRLIDRGLTRGAFTHSCCLSMVRIYKVRQRLLSSMFGVKDDTIRSRIVLQHYTCALGF